MDGPSIRCVIYKNVFHQTLLKIGGIVVTFRILPTKDLLQHHQVSSNSDEKQKSFIYNLFNGWSINSSYCGDSPRVRFVLAT